MYIFRDYYNNEVKLSFEDHPFSNAPKHVWVICRYGNRWLLTKHKERGLEFPGGKVEIGETAKQAAIREVMEETGGSVEKIHYVGQYFVSGKTDTVIKNVYVAEIDELIQQETYYETKGPVLLESIPKNIKQNGLYSFIMKDGVLDHCMDYIKAERNRLI
ncbi:nucleoside triphosphatase YtkD [Virgibacillus profundi]|uniref:Nucleoside triphosphatase YtkD n=1 Tax=Virgibacillus profundi TaxID=2024555 RepID=A0A2A2I8N0_9BACI|nr:nucleoside triphosphatase YtkD [Virgibacillus profundi]PAV27738.1 nucleoside triphosphatase YtkD [Virgibacillus profundi]PXY51893.1 nucleoside triphosphatase YtkD [Virgibacillus profundi]